MKRVVVTGASGFIGSHTIKAIRKDFKIVPVDIRGSDVYKCDITTPEFAEHIAEGDKILHLAGMIRFEECAHDPQLAVKINVQGTLNVVKCGIKENAERIIFSSSGSVYGPENHFPLDETGNLGPHTQYGLTKVQAEAWVELYKSQLPYVILRYPYIYGPLKDWGAIGMFIKLLQENNQPTIFGGDQSNDFTYIKDIIQANILSINTKHINNVFNIGTGRPTSIRDVCEICKKFLGSNIKPKILPSRSFDYPIFVYNINKARTLLGYEPKWNILDGIEDTIKEMNVKC